MDAIPLKIVNNIVIIHYITNFLGGIMNIITTLIPSLKILTLSAVFFVWFVRYQNIVEEFKKYNYSSKLRDFVGILKIASVLLIQTSSSINVKVGSATLAFLMLAAFITHIRVKNSFGEFIPSLTLLIFSVIFFFNA